MYLELSAKTEKLLAVLTPAASTSLKTWRARHHRGHLLCHLHDGGMRPYRGPREGPGRRLPRCVRWPADGQRVGSRRNSSDVPARTGRLNQSIGARSRGSSQTSDCKCELPGPWVERSGMLAWRGVLKSVESLSAASVLAVYPQPRAGAFLDRDGSASSEKVYYPTDQPRHRLSYRVTCGDNENSDGHRQE
jgi:hypothetical protein